MESPAPIKGGWGDWGSWSECSRTCGAGVSIMERECDHPRPTAGGGFCVGERRRYRMCNIDPCPEDQPTFRAVQCSSFNNRTYEGKKYTWVPYFDKGKAAGDTWSISGNTLSSLQRRGLATLFLLKTNVGVQVKSLYLLLKLFLFSAVNKTLTPLQFSLFKIESILQTGTVYFQRCNY